MKKLSRREFMKEGSSSVALVSFPVIFKANPVEGFGNARAEALPLSGYYEIFGVDEALIRRIMGVDLAKGGDYCDLYFQNGVVHYIGLEDNIVKQWNGW